MTVAVCSRCGARKLGALTRCVACGALPETPVEKAHALLMSDHYASAEQLAEASEAIRAGREPALDPAAVDQLAEEIRRAPDDEKLPLGCAIIPWILIGATVLMAALVVVLWYLNSH